MNFLVNVLMWAVSGFVVGGAFLGWFVALFLWKQGKFHIERRTQLVNEPLTQADVAKMHFDKVWISYGDDLDDGEWGVILYGRLYSIDTLEGAGFEDNLVEGFGDCGETLNRPTGEYKVYLNHAKSQILEIRCGSCIEENVCPAAHTGVCFPCPYYERRKK